MDLERRRIQEALVDLLGDGDHLLQVCPPGPPTLVSVEDYGADDFGDRVFRLEVHDPSSENNLPLEWIVDHVRWLKNNPVPAPRNNQKYRILPGLSAERYLALKEEIALNGVQVSIIVDQYGNIIEGWHRWRICQDLGIPCPTEVRYFNNETERFHLILTINCSRRQLNSKQKRNLIASYLKVDSAINDNWLGEIIGISKNTVARERILLENAHLIPRHTHFQGKDGKRRPAKSKKIIANSPKEVAKAQEIISDLPQNCAGKTLDINTAKRRANRCRNKEERARRRTIVSLPDDAIKLYHCRFQELERVAGLLPASANLFLTDIPYGKSFLPQVTELAELAQRLLKEGGLFVCLCGQYWLPKVMEALGRSLTYRWMDAYLWDGGCQFVNIGGWGIPQGRVMSRWKPILVHSKGDFTKKGLWSDIHKVDLKEKQFHPWQQPLELFQQLLLDFTEPGDLVVDPCGGSFTTAEACLRIGRPCISCDVEGGCVQIGHERIERARNTLANNREGLDPS